MHFRRFAHLRFAMIAGLGLASAFAFAGCDKKVEAPAAPGTPAPTAPGGKASSSVAVVDIDKVLEDLGWARNLRDNLASLGQELTRERDALVSQMNAMLTEKRATLVKDAKLNTEQAGWLAEGKLDKLTKELTEQQRNDYVQLVMAMQNFVNQANQRAELVARGWANEATNAYTTQMQPAFRRAADNAGVSVVLPSRAALYSNASMNLTDKVVDDLKGTQPPPLPAFPRLGMKVEANPTSQPAVAPSATPATTKPAR